MHYFLLMYNIVNVLVDNLYLFPRIKTLIYIENLQACIQTKVSKVPL